MSCGMKKKPKLLDKSAHPFFDIVYFLFLENEYNKDCSESVTSYSNFGLFPVFYAFQYNVFATKTVFMLASTTRYYSVTSL